MFLLFPWIIGTCLRWVNFGHLFPGVSEVVVVLACLAAWLVIYCHVMFHHAVDAELLLIPIIDNDPLSILHVYPQQKGKNGQKQIKKRAGAVLIAWNWRWFDLHSHSVGAKCMGLLGWFQPCMYSSMECKFIPLLPVRLFLVKRSRSRFKCTGPFPWTFIRLIILLAKQN